jgi:hypothetical protein
MGLIISAKTLKHRKRPPFSQCLDRAKKFHRRYLSNSRELSKHILFDYITGFRKIQVFTKINPINCCHFFGETENLSFSQESLDNDRYF